MRSGAIANRSIPAFIADCTVEAGTSGTFGCPSPTASALNAECAQIRLQVQSGAAHREVPKAADEAPMKAGLRPQTYSNRRKEERWH